MNVNACNENELRNFAHEHVFWWGDRWHHVDRNALLVFILAKKTTETEELARERFGFTDEDFKEALRQTPPGLFLFPSDWEETNRRFGIIPPLPFPKISPEEELKELEELRRQAVSL